MKTKKVKLGKYRHFKGHLCNVIGVAKHSENPKEEFVVYEHTYDDGKMQLWIRPKEMFLEMVVVKNKKVPRFEFWGNKSFDFLKNEPDIYSVKDIKKRFIK